MRQPVHRLALAITLLFAVPSGAAAEPQLRPVDIRARPISQFGIGSDETRFGELEFLGGLELTSDKDEFGSLSGIDFDTDGRLHAVTDRGAWLSAELEETGGAPSGLTEAWMARMRDPSGSLPSSKVAADAEGIRLATTGGRAVMLVSFERIHEIRIFDLPIDPTAAPERMRLPRFVTDLRANQGIEAVAIAAHDGPLAGAVVALAERSLDQAGNHRGFVLDGPRAGEFSVGRSGGFDITDAAFLPNGDLAILERRFSFATGLAIRIRRINGALIRPGRIVSGTTLMEAGIGHQIDNLEGLAIRARANGDTILTLVSDNNHSLLQRTLLLQFRLLPSTYPLPRPRPERKAAVR